MLKFFRREQTTLDELIEGVQTQLQQTTPGTDEYNKLLGNLSTLEGLKTKNSRKPVSGDTIVMVVGNFIIVVFVTVYENKHVFRATRAFQMFNRPKAD